MVLGVLGFHGLTMVFGKLLCSSAETMHLRFWADTSYSCNAGDYVYLVQGDSNNLSINGHYVPNDQSYNGYPVYVQADGNKFLFWASYAGGLWVIADTISDTVSPMTIERDYDADPELSNGVAGPRARGWQIWAGGWVLSELSVSGGKSLWFLWFSGGFCGVRSFCGLHVTMVLWFNHGLSWLTLWFCLPSFQKAHVFRKLHN